MKMNYEYVKSILTYIGQNVHVGNPVPNFEISDVPKEFVQEYLLMLIDAKKIIGHFDQNTNHMQIMCLSWDGWAWLEEHTE